MIYNFNFNQNLNRNLFEHSEFPNSAINITFDGAIEGVSIDYLKREIVVYENVKDVKILIYQNTIFSIFKIKSIIIIDSYILYIFVSYKLKKHLDLNDT